MKAYIKKMFYNQTLEIQIIHKIQIKKAVNQA